MTAVATYTAPGPSLLSAVRRVLGDADEALVCVAFAQVRGVELLRKELSDVAARKSARVLVTTSFGATDPRALAAIVDTKALVGVLNPAGATFHPKVFLGRRGRTIRAIVGSANLTGGLFTNVEVAMGIDGNHDDPALHRLWSWAEETWSDPRVERWMPPLGVVAAEAIEPELLALMQRVAMESPEVYTLGPRPRPNWLREVATSGAWVETERSRERSGAPVFVPSWMLNLAWEALRSRGTLSNRELLDDLRVHRSSFVCALLARLPEIERVPGRDIVLRWTGGAPEPVNAGGDGKRMPSSSR